MEIVTLERSLHLNTKGMGSKLEYVRVSKATAKAINMTGGFPCGSIMATKLVAKEKSLKYKTLDCEEMVGVEFHSLGLCPCHPKQTKHTVIIFMDSSLLYPGKR